MNIIIEDKEFGEIVIRRNALAKYVSFKIAPSGRVQMTVPKYTSTFLAKRFLKSNRELIRKLPLKNPKTQRARDAKKKILMKKAKDYLPYRLDYFAKLYGYHYDKFKLSHASTRWGSCTRHYADGTITISLNIGLMQLPKILQDHVIIHELAHINHPDHSAAFWAEVGEHDPRFKDHRRRLKSYSPGV